MANISLEYASLPGTPAAWAGLLWLSTPDVPAPGRCREAEEHPNDADVSSSS